MAKIMNSNFYSPVKLVGLCLVVALTACGGGSNDTPVTAVDPVVPEPPVVVPTPVNPGIPSNNRIEPLDLGLPKAASAASLKASERSAALPPASVRLGPVGESQSLLTKNAAGYGAPQQIGVSRSVVATATAKDTLAQLTWRPAGSGLQRAAISFTADGALGVRLGVLVRSLPSGSTMRFYAQSGGNFVQVSREEVLRIVQRNLDAGDVGDSARTYWAPDFGGAETTLELEVPVRANLAELDIAVPSLSHFVVSPEQATASASFTKVGESGTCNVDVSCKAEFTSESRSVARMIYVRDGGSFLCTGTLLNDIQSSTTPYFLSAFHCISSQSVASSLTTDWFYRSTACNSGSLNLATQRLQGGAVLLHASATTDTSFMRLNNPPPQGSVYAGTYFGDMTQNANVAGVHHPRGDLQKVSTGALARFSNCSNEVCAISTPADGRFLTVGWSEGTTEGGSSGSGLFFGIGSSRYLVGQLYGGASSCQVPAGRDHYGRFDLAFRSALKQWLVPGS
ncbi:MAG: trypsin-like serine peptidase [Acidovorax sp.]|uniref:trypsin-like serine peptidase n=1 Tax=Acidovorax sp. TaxID=1872122 RepID=UPI00391A78F9